MALDLDLVRGGLVQRRFGKWLGAALGGVAAAIVLLMFIFDHEPEHFDVVARAAARAERDRTNLVTGYVTTATLIEVVDTLLGKRYLDPTCGSGVFLVLLFQRMAAEWRWSKPVIKRLAQAGSGCLSGARLAIAPPVRYSYKGL